MSKVFWQHICERRARNTRDITSSNYITTRKELKSTRLRKLNINGTARPPTAMPLRNRHIVHFTRPVCPPFLLQAHIECCSEMVRARVYDSCVTYGMYVSRYIFEISFHHYYACLQVIRCDPQDTLLKIFMVSHIISYLTSIFLSDDR